MVFSSCAFIFCFFPIVLLAYFICKKISDKICYRNAILCAFSLFFYAWGEPVYVFLMLFSIIINYLVAICIDRQQDNRKTWLTIAIIVNILIIGFFKYSDFLIENVNRIFECQLSLPELALPIGISFYTFQIMSYVIDVYRQKVCVQKSLLKLTTYISLFPQLIAGPIVRYETIENQLSNRTETIEDFTSGLRRFIVGLGKKVIIANSMAASADLIFDNNVTQFGTTVLWFGVICYTLQIYFDFSGYSDMAIGIGRMFGFRFLENFNYPYISKSITEFWRRWHISLSSWFRDYVYISLGGNRTTKIKWIRNIVIVWALTGLWHGASWNFVFWGLYYCIILLIEKLCIGNFLNKMPNWFGHIYAVVLFCVGWVIFRLENFADILYVIKTMFVYKSDDIIGFIVSNYDVAFSLMLIPVAIIGSMPIIKCISNRFRENNLYYFIKTFIIFIIFLMCIIMLIASTYNPFIYFRF